MSSHPQSASPSRPDRATAESSAARRRILGLGLGLLLGWLSLFGLVACGRGTEDPAADSSPESASTPATATPRGAATPAIPQFDLKLAAEDLVVEPLPLRAGFPFTVTAVIHNNTSRPAVNVPLLVHLSALREEIGYSPFVQVFTVTVPASQTLTVSVPVNWNLAGGEHRLWVQLNSLPDGWQSQAPAQPEASLQDNTALLELMVDPFDGYTSELCPARVDAEIQPADVVPEPGKQRVFVRVHNEGNRALYNLPVVVVAGGLTGIAYTAAIPPCGGTTGVYVTVNGPFPEGAAVTVRVNPPEWEGPFAEDRYENNQVAVAAGLQPGMVIPPGSGLEDYDFGLDVGEIESPEPWLVVVTIHNLGTRDAANVPILIQNEAGRKLSDTIPLVRGEGLGVAAIRIGYLWTRGGKLTFTVNPEGAPGAYPEARRENNVVVFALD